jgi:hypothetical protein
LGILNLSLRLEVVFGILKGSFIGSEAFAWTPISQSRLVCFNEDISLVQ